MYCSPTKSALSASPSTQLNWVTNVSPDREEGICFLGEWGMFYVHSIFLVHFAKFY